MQIKQRISKMRLINHIPNWRAERKNMFLKFVPFIIENFVAYVQNHSFAAEHYYLERVLECKPQDKKKYNIIDIIQIFSCSHLKNIQLLWKLFLRIEAKNIIIDKIYSQRVQIYYFNKLDQLIEQLQQKRAYKDYIALQLILEGLSVFDPKYNVFKQNDDVRILVDYYPVDQNKFKFNIYNLLASFQQHDEPEKRLNTLQAIVDIVKHFNQIDDVDMNQKIVTDQNIWYIFYHDMTDNQRKDVN